MPFGSAGVDGSVTFAVQFEGIEQVKKEISGLRAETEKAFDGIEQGGQGAERSMLAIGAAAAAAAAGLIKMGSDAVGASVEFDRAFTEVSKLLEGTPEEINSIRDAVKDMALQMPAATTEISNVAAAAARLGVATGDIADFTRVMVMLGTSTTLSATEAADTLARFANVTNMAASDYERLASSIVELGNNFATTETEIANMAMRIGSAGSQVDMTQAQIVGFAAALSSVGMEAQAGGTAISKLMIDMKAAADNGVIANRVLEQTGYTLREMEMLIDSSAGDFKALAQSMGMTSAELKSLVGDAKSLEQFAEVAGMTADQFSRAFGENAAATMEKFFAGLSSGSKSAISVLNDLGIADVRMRDALLRLSNAQGMFTDALNISNQAWEDNTSLVGDAQASYETMSARMAIMNNSTEQLAMEFGNALAPAVMTVVDLITGLAQGFTGLMRDNPILAAGITGIAVAMGAAAIGVGLYTAASFLAEKATLAFNAALAANPVALVVIAVIGLAVAVASLANDFGSARSELETLTDAIARMDEAQRRIAQADNTSALAERYRALREAIDGGRLSSEELAAAQEELVAVKLQLAQASDGVISSIDGETAAFDAQLETLERITEAQRALGRMEYIDALKTFAASYSGGMREMEEALDRAGAAQEKYIQRTQGAGGEATSFLLELEVQAKSLQRAVSEGLLETQDGIAQYEAEIERLTTALSDITGGEWAAFDLSGLMIAISEVQRETQDLSGTWAEQEGIAAELRKTLETGLRRAMEGVTAGYYDMEYAAAAFGMTAEEFEATVAALASGAELTVEAFEAIVDATEPMVRQLTEFETKLAETGIELEDFNKRLGDYAKTATDVFDVIKQADVLSPEKMIANLRENQRALEEWADNYEAFAARMDAVDGGGALMRLVDQWGPEYANQLKALVGASDETLQELADSLMSGFQLASDVANREVDALYSGMADGQAAGAERVREGTRLIVDALTGEVTVAEMYDAGRERTEAFTQGAADGLTTGAEMAAMTAFDDPVKFLQEMFGETATYRGEEIPEAATVGANLVESVAGGAEAEIPQLQSTAEDMAGAVLDTLDEFAPKAKDAGSEFGVNYIGGIIDGMRSMESELYDVISDIVAQMVQTARDAAEIASPSRKMARLFSKPFIEGMGYHFEDGAREMFGRLYDAVEDGQDRIASAAQNWGDRQALAAGADGGSVEGAGGVGPVTLNFNQPWESPWQVQRRAQEGILVALGRA